MTLADAADPGLCTAYWELLTPEEQERHDRYRFPQHRHQYLVTRALVRTVLSRYALITPRDWAFRINDHGKPEAICAAGPRLCFNLSNTDGMVACLVALDRDVGVDVEDTLREQGALLVADQSFSKTEVAQLRALPAAQQPARFFEYWTLKESYIKARGLGLSIPLSSFTFTLEPGRTEVSIRVTVDPSQGDDGRCWQFCLQRPNPRHLIACCIRRCGAPELDSVRLIVRPIVPLRSG